ncbi:MAG: response regulator [Pseudomonadales bacterium]|nr:response regulator [Pseudomonadales bacterium]
MPKLLIVDDQANNLFTLREILKELENQIEVIEASSGEEALLQVMNHSFFLILMDVQMPNMSGIEAATLIQRRQNHHTPIIFVTANDNEKSTIRRGYGAGAVDYIYKPIEEDFLISKINVFLKLWSQEQQLLAKNKVVEEMMASVASNNLALQHSNKELEDFAHIVSHDIKQPINSIIGFTQLVLNHGENLDDRQADSMRRVISSANRMTGLINQLLEFAKVDTDPFTNEDVDLDIVIQDVLEDLQDLIGKSHAKISVGPVFTIHNNFHHLYQILLNLLNNALKFSKPGINPEISIDCQQINEGTECTLIISDNGIGFDSKHATEIFSPFTRLKTTEHEGSGIGLGTVERIVKRHNGHIGVDSTPGIGSTFTVHLPIHNINTPSQL